MMHTLKSPLHRVLTRSSPKRSLVSNFTQSFLYPVYHPQCSNFTQSSFQYPPPTTSTTVNTTPQTSTKSPTLLKRIAREKSNTVHLVRRNANLHYLDLTVGSPSSTPYKTLICLHSSYQTAYTFEDVITSMESIPIFGGSLRILALDLRGHGESSFKNDGEQYSIRMIREDLAEFIDIMNIRDFYLMGVGLGGLACLDYVSSYSSLIDLLGTIVCEVDSKHRLQRVEDSRRDKRFTTFDDFVDAILSLNPSSTEESVRRRLRHALKFSQGQWTWKCDPAFSLSNILNMEHDMIHRKIQGLGKDVKIRVMYGEKSSSVSDSSIDEFLAHLNTPTSNVSESALKRCSLYRQPGTSYQADAVKIAGASHHVQGDNPHQLALETLKFMEMV